MQHKHDAFDYPDNNILMYTVTWEEDLLRQNFEITKDEDIFFPSSIDRVRLDKFKTDVLISGGMNPWVAASNASYPLTLAGVGISRVLLAGVLVIGYLF